MQLPGSICSVNLSLEMPGSTPTISNQPLADPILRKSLLNPKVPTGVGSRSAAISSMKGGGCEVSGAGNAKPDGYGSTPRIGAALTIVIDTTVSTPATIVLY